MSKIRKTSFLKCHELKRLGYEYEGGNFVSNIHFSPSGVYYPNMPSMLVEFLSSYENMGWYKEALEDFIETY